MTYKYPLKSVTILNDFENFEGNGETEGTRCFCLNATRALRKEAHPTETGPLQSEGVNRDNADCFV